MALGISVEFLAHTAYEHLRCEGTREERAFHATWTYPRPRRICFGSYTHGISTSPRRRREPPLWTPTTSHVLPGTSVLSSTAPSRRSSVSSRSRSRTTSTFAARDRSPTNRGDAAAATRIFCESRRRRGRHVDILCVAATPRPRRGYSVESRRRRGRGRGSSVWTGARPQVHPALLLPALLDHPRLRPRRRHRAVSGDARDRRRGMMLSAVGASHYHFRHRIFAPREAPPPHSLRPRRFS